MSSVREAYVSADGYVAALLRHPAVSANWDKPSALAKFRVSGLAGHLARQVLNAPMVLAHPVPDGGPISLLDHYRRSEWVDAGLDSEVNETVRRSGEETASCGPQELAARVAEVSAGLSNVLAAEPADRAVGLPWTSWALTLDDFLVTRLMEIAVHGDDLAVSIDIVTPELPSSVFDPTALLLVQLAARRHGQSAVLRALSRAERAPATITAF